MKKHEITMGEIADAVGIKPVEATLPNGRVVHRIEWKPEHLKLAFSIMEGAREPKSHVLLSGAAPGWAIACVVHAAHPAYVSYEHAMTGSYYPANYSEIGPEHEGISFTLTGDDKHYLTYELQDPVYEMNNLFRLQAPELASYDKPIMLSGRGPHAIMLTLAEAYAHRVPAVYVFQPMVGYVCAISHTAEHKLGDVVK